MLLASSVNSGRRECQRRVAGRSCDGPQQACGGEMTVKVDVCTVARQQGKRGARPESAKRLAQAQAA
jgi:hypothetical protein